MEEKTKARDELLVSIKTSEARLAEIATLKKHIINYSKTRSTYEEYARLLSGKKTAYAEYRKLRDEAQELLIAQSNIGSIYDFAGGKLLRQEKEEQKR